MALSSRIGPSSEPRRIEALALESRVSIATVQQLYEDECAKLDAMASVKSFLPIFAIRNVRDRLTELRDRPR